MATQHRKDSKGVMISKENPVTISAAGLPAEIHLGEQLTLSKSDTRTVPSHLSIIYLFPVAADSKRGTSVEVLTRSLAHALRVYYPLAGRLGYLHFNNQKRLVINCNNEGVPFFKATADVALADAIPDFTQPASFPPGLSSSPPPSLLPILSHPMLTVQATQFSCGGLVLAASFHHMCTDGRGFFAFMHAWGCLARGHPFPAPCHKRSLTAHRWPEDGPPPMAGVGELTYGNGPVRIKGKPVPVDAFPAQENGKTAGLDPNGSNSAPLLSSKSAGNGTAANGTSEAGAKGTSNGSAKSRGLSEPRRSKLWDLLVGAGRDMKAFLRAAVSLADLLAQCLHEPAMSSVCIQFSPTQLQRIKQEASTHWEATGEQKREGPGDALRQLGGRGAGALSQADVSGVTFVSTDDALCAALVQAITRARGLAANPSGQVTFRRAVDSRPRLQPPLPEEYFGNAVLGDHPEHFTTTVGELLSTPLPKVARFLRRALQGVDEAYCRAFWAQRPPATGLSAVFPPYVGRGIMITSWAKFDMYSCDFGSGTPAFVCVSYGTKPRFVSGSVIFQRGSKGDGGMDAVVVLPAKAISKLLADPVLFE